MSKPVQLLAALLLAGLIIAGCGGTEQASGDAASSTAVATTAPKATATTLPGSPDVYGRIAKLTDCTKLQEEFDRAEATSKRSGGPQGATWSEIGIAYMQAADDRMRAVGCY